MSRNSGGVYSLPSGNPVVGGTVIEADWANPTLDDVASALTDSLSRTGLGAMSAPFKSVNGSLGAPGVAFSGDTTSGMFLSAAGDLQVSVAATAVARWTGGKYYVKDLSATFREVVYEAKLATTLGALTTTGLLTAGSLTVTGVATFNGAATFNDPITFTDPLAITDATVSGVLTATGTTALAATTITGGLNIDAITATAAVIALNFVSSGDSTIEANFTTNAVSGVTTLLGPVTCGQTFQSNGAVTFLQGLTGTNAGGLTITGSNGIGLSTSAGALTALSVGDLTHRTTTGGIAISSVTAHPAVSAGELILTANTTLKLNSIGSTVLSSFGETAITQPFSTNRALRLSSTLQEIYYPASTNRALSASTTQAALYRANGTAAVTLTNTSTTLATPAGVNGIVISDTIVNIYDAAGTVIFVINRSTGGISMPNLPTSFAAGVLGELYRDGATSGVAIKIK
jgi:hypothetical protein